MEYEIWLDEWLEEYVKTATKIRTYEKYRQQTERYIIPDLGKYDLCELSAKVLQSFAARLSNGELSSNTVNGILSVVKNSLRRAVSAGAAERQFADSMLRPKTREKRIECFKKDEQRKIENYIFSRNQPKLFGIVFCLYTGLRIGELLALEWSDIDMANGVVFVAKTCRDSWENGSYVKIIDTPKTVCSARAIPIPRQLLPRLQSIRNKSAGKYLVEGKNEYGAQVRSYQKTFEKLLARLGIPHKGFHALRHTFATRALECGMDVKALSEILGHRNPTITLNRYAHSFMEHKSELMNKLGQLLL